MLPVPLKISNENYYIDWFSFRYCFVFVSTLLHSFGHGRGLGLFLYIENKFMNVKLAQNIRYV